MINLCLDKSSPELVAKVNNLQHVANSDTNSNEDILSTQRVAENQSNNLQQVVATEEEPTKRVIGDQKLAFLRGVGSPSTNGNDDDSCSDSSSDSDSDVACGVGGDTSSGKDTDASVVDDSAKSRKQINSKQKRRRKKKERAQEKHSPQTKSIPRQKSLIHSPSLLSASGGYSGGSSDQGKSKPTHKHNSVAEEHVCLTSGKLDPPHERSESTISASLESNSCGVSMKEGGHSLVDFHHFESIKASSDSDHAYWSQMVQTVGLSPTFLCVNQDKIVEISPPGNALVSGISTLLSLMNHVIKDDPLLPSQSNPPDPVCESMLSYVRTFSNIFSGIQHPVYSVSIYIHYFVLMWAMPSQ